MTKIRPTDRN